ncbi:DUF6233 domain-containing protein [Streptomyces lydicus]|uniref:DUF6233 domain-containing protein n=1 Tax=Streptomyces lydicus TaxID=47763 RepID=UPI0037CF29AF
MPSWVATQAGVEAAEYGVWDIRSAPANRGGGSVLRSDAPAPARASSTAALRVGCAARCGAARRNGGAYADCRQAGGGGVELGAMEALDALMRPGARACHDCDAAAVLVPALELGQGQGQGYA